MSEISILTGAAIGDLAQGKFSLVALSILLLVIVAVGAFFAICSYFIVQLSKHRHVEFRFNKKISRIIQRLKKYF